MELYDKIWKPKKIILSNGKIVEERRSRTPFAILLLVIATAVSVKITGFSLKTILTRGGQFFVIFLEIIFPSL